MSEKLADLFKGMLAGTANLGIASMPLLKAYQLAKKDPAWKEKAFKDWLTEDEEAAVLLERVLKEIKTTIPEDKRIALIVALGGIPSE